MTSQEKPSQPAHVAGTPTLRVRLLRPEAKLPVRAYPTDSGADAFAVDSHLLFQLPHKVPLGIACEIPEGYELQVRPRSGLSSRGIHVALGTVDQSYTGEICAIMWSTLGKSQVIEAGSKVCQLVLAPVALPVIVQVDDIGETERGENGFGSTDGRP